MKLKWTNEGYQFAVFTPQERKSVAELWDTGRCSSDRPASSTTAPSRGVNRISCKATSCKRRRSLLLSQP